MIYIRPIGNLGNWLHQYCYARLLADEMGYNLKFKGVSSRNIVYNNIKEYFPNIIEIKDRATLSKKIRKINKDRYRNKIFDIANEFNNKDISIVIKGNFEYYGLYTQEQQNKVKYYTQCRQHLDRNNLLPHLFQIIKDGTFIKEKIESITDNDIVIHLRLGNFLYHQKRLLLFDYFKQVLDMAKYDRVFIVSGDLVSPLLYDFHNSFYEHYKFSPIYYNRENKSYMNDFNMVRLFNKIAISQSSFTWWAAFLSNAKEIYYPVTVFGPWNAKKKTNRWVNEDRYIYVQENKEEAKRRVRHLKNIKFKDKK